MSLNAYIAMFHAKINDVDFDVTPGRPNSDEQDTTKMQIEGIHATAPYVGWTAVLSFDHLIKRNNHGNFTFIKDVDDCSPDLAYFASCGRAIGTVKFIIAHRNKTDTPKVVYRFKDAEITSVRPHHAGTVLDSNGAALNSEREFISVQYKRVYWDAFNDSNVHVRSASWSISSNAGDPPTSP